MNKSLKILFWLVIAAIFLLVAALMIPGIRSRIASRVDTVAGRLFYSMNKPEEQVFVPQGETKPQVLVVTMTPTSGPTAIPTVPQPTDQPSPTTEPTATATIEPTLLPPSALQDGITYVTQTGRYNFCAPANMDMALNYWGWQGNVDELASVIKPFNEDFNVMPYEMVNYVQQYTNLGIALRYGGTQDVLKRFIASGFPVLIEKGIYHMDLSGVESWMGHYNMVDGYDDAKGQFRTQDSLIKQNNWVSYTQLDNEWRSFNFAFMVVYPPERQQEVQQLLGEYASEEDSYRIAAELAAKEADELKGINQFFAWYNRGSSLVGLSDYAGAAKAYDEAYAVYPSIAGSQRPWRMTWYQTGPYFAYYYTGRYQDVIDLATQTLEHARKPYLEESYYWRAMARLKTGDQPGAVADLCESLKYHPAFPPSTSLLGQLGVSSCP